MLPPPHSTRAQNGHLRRNAEAAFEELDSLLVDAEISVVPFDAAQARVARQAYAKYARGSGSRAGLNYGDCMTYALAKVTGEPLLFKGDDFIHTDLESALQPSQPATRKPSSTSSRTTGR